MRLLLTGLVFIAVLAVPFFIWGNLFSEDVQELQEKINLISKVRAALSRTARRTLESSTKSSKE